MEINKFEYAEKCPVLCIAYCITDVRNLCGSLEKRSNDKGQLMKKIPDIKLNITSSILRAIIVIWGCLATKKKLNSKFTRKSRKKNMQTCCSNCKNNDLLIQFIVELISKKKKKTLK